MKRRDKLKILYIINGLGYGGAETWLLEIVKLNKAHHQIDFLLTGGVKQGLDDAFELCGCRLYYCRFSRKNILSFIHSLRTIVSKGDYDVVHDHEDFVAGWHWLFLIGKLPKARITHAHNSTVYIDNYLMTGKRNFFYKVGRKLVAFLSTKISGTSNQLMDELHYGNGRFLKKRIEPLYCGIDPQHFMYDEHRRKVLRFKLGFSDQDKVVIFIGRIGLIDSIYKNSKNPMFAFELARLVCKEHNNLKFLFVGEKGELGFQLEKIVEQESLTGKIFFLDKRADVSDLLSASDLMLFTSGSEGFGLTLVEAQFSGLPILASDTAIEEAIQFRELFTFLNLGESVETWGKKIEEILNLPFDRGEFTSKYKSEIIQSKFSIQQSYKRLIDHYSY